MSSESAIEWTDATWNPVTGCSKVSPGCAHCYAETLALNRLAGKAGYPGLPWTPANAATNVVLRPERLDQPLRWRKPRMVFVNSMSDLFHDQVPDDFIADVFAVMARAPQHTFQVLTKRPERMQQLLGSPAWQGKVTLRAAGEGEITLFWPLPNVWLGTSIENRRYVGRADLLRDTPAAVRFISAEPLLGPLVWDGVTYQSHGDGGRPEPIPAEAWEDGFDGPDLDLTDIDWLIVGGESGKGHRPISETWVQDLLYRCEEEDTAFFLKQMGGYRPGGALEDLPEELRVRQWPKDAASIAGDG
jgi:protein gp37